MKGHVDPRLLEVVAKIAEEQHATGRAIAEMAKSFDKLATVLQQHTQILGGMDDAVKLMRKRMGDVQSISADDPV